MFAPVSELLPELRSVLPKAAFRDPEPYLSEPRGRFTGQGSVIAPANTDEVAQIMALAHGAGVAVVPYGGGTGLVGGQLAGGDPLILSLERVRAVRHMDPTGLVLEVEAGLTLDETRASAQEHGLMFPLSLASGGSARIGGVLATNAGGVNVLRYGNARALCLGIEAVLADGRIWRGLSGLRKANMGYDLRDLLIGSEGSLGVITAASLRLVPQPRAQGAALLVVPGVAQALDLLALAQARLGEVLSAFELISGQGLRFMAETGVPGQAPFDPIPEWMVLLDLGMGQGSADAALADLFEEAHGAGLSSDGVIASNAAQRAALWQLREHIPQGNRRVGAIASHDISVPIGKIAAFIVEAATILNGMEDLRINCFGHLGDGNLHYNLFPVPGRRREDYEAASLSRAVHDLVAQYGGAFSAEHGVGRLKVADLERYGDPVGLEMMRAVKHALDPKGILNPGAVLAQSPS